MGYTSLTTQWKCTENINKLCTYRQNLEFTVAETVKFKHIKFNKSIYKNCKLCYNI